MRGDTPPLWWLVNARPTGDGRTIVRIAFRDRTPAEVMFPGRDPTDDDIEQLAALALKHPPPPRRPT